jgi:hypothetical protein
MTITIKLNTDNAAFSDSKDAEVQRILRVWLAEGATSGKLRDYNGNTVGTVTITGK